MRASARRWESWKSKKEDVALSWRRGGKFVKAGRFPRLCSYSMESLGEDGHKTIRDHHSLVVLDATRFSPAEFRPRRLPGAGDVAGLLGLQHSFG